MTISQNSNPATSRGGVQTKSSDHLHLRPPTAQALFHHPHSPFTMVPMPSKPKLLFLITDLHLGGAPRFLADLIAGLKSIDDFDLLAVSIARLPQPPKDSSVVDSIRAAGVEVVSLNASSAHDWRVVNQFIHLMNKYRPQIVCSILIHANILATLARPFCSATRYIHSIHTLQPKPRWHWYAQGLISPFADGFVAPTQAIIDRVSTYGLVQSAAAIPNGIDIARFRDAPHLPPEASPAPQGTPLIGYMGRFDPVKNLGKVVAAYDLYVQEIKRLRTIIPHLVLVGYGPEESRLRQQVQTLGLEGLVHFPGPTNRPEQWLKSFDCLVLASEVEGYPLSIAESLAAGTPVVAVESPAIRAIVGNSYPLCKTSEINALLSGIRDVMHARMMWITRFCRVESITDKKNMSHLYNNFFKIFCISFSK